MKPYISLLLLLTLPLMLSCNVITVCSKPPWLKPGLYVEYKISNGDAVQFVLVVAREILIEEDLLHKYKIGNSTVITDLELEEFMELMRSRNITDIGRKPGEFTIISSYSNFHERLIKAYKEGRLPKIPEEYGSYVMCQGGYSRVNASYSWLLLGFKDGLAQVNVRFNGWVKNESTGETEHIDFNFTVYIDPDSRKAFTAEGKYLGIVPFWISNAQVGSRVPILSLHGQIINGTISGEADVETPLGAFRAYSIHRTDKTINFPGMEHVYFDRIRGILLSTRGYADPILLHYMNISCILTGKQPIVVSKLEYYELPSRIIPTWRMLQIAGVIALAAASIIVALTIYMRKHRAPYTP